MLRLKLCLVDLRGDTRYRVAIVPCEWFSAYLNTLICVVFLSLEAISHKLHIFTKSNISFNCLCMQPPSPSMVDSLFRFAVPLLKSDVSDIREAVIVGLGRTNPCSYR